MNWATLVFAVSLVLGTEMIARAIGRFLRRGCI